MAKAKNPQCVEEVSQYDGLACYRHRCTRQGWDQHGGRWYCKQHHPENVRAKQEERKAAWDKEWAERRAKDAEVKDMRAAWQILKSINPEDPLSVAQKLVGPATNVAQVNPDSIATTCSHAEGKQEEVSGVALNVEGE